MGKKPSDLTTEGRILALLEKTTIQNTNIDKVKRIFLALVETGWIFQKVDTLNSDGSLAHTKGWEPLRKRDQHMSIPDFVKWGEDLGYALKRD